MSARFKAVEKTIRAAGGRRCGRTREAILFQMPDDAQFLVPTDVSSGHAAGIIGDVKHRYTVASRSPISGRKADAPPPTIDLEKTWASGHAKERLELMREQGGVTFQEVTIALTAPARVLWSQRHNSWVWVGDRVAVVGQMDDDGWFRIASLLWTTKELWAEHPRPEKEKAS